MSTVTTMSQAPRPPPPTSTSKPPPPPPPPTSTSTTTPHRRSTTTNISTKSNSTGRSRSTSNSTTRTKPPPPPPRRPPPPPPPSSKSSMTSGRKRPPPPHPTKGSGSGGAVVASTPKRKRFGVSIQKPVVLRDVDAFLKKQQVGEGTYGSVFMGADKVTGEIVALKRINTKQEDNGFPITAIREVKILKALNHENVIQLKEIVTSKEQGTIPKNVFMVFEYMDYDLTGILETPEIRLSHDHLKSWAHQLLHGVHYMHVNHILHRDLKSSNLLIGSNGVLKIADWGLSRSWTPNMKNLTNGVITLWYRPTELLLGAKEYSTKIDMWSVGCILAEMFRRAGLLRGTVEDHQLHLIFETLGHPSLEEWPDIHRMCPLWKKHEPRNKGELKRSNLKQVLLSRLPKSQAAWMTNSAIELISNLLEHNPSKRWDARTAMLSEYFYEKPVVKEADKLNMRFSVGSVHEWEARKKHQARMNAQRSNTGATNGTRARP